MKKELREMIDQGYVCEKKHPTLDLYIYDYTPKATYEKVWNDVTLNCRGVVLDGDGLLVAHPFPKFFNYEELDGLGMEIPKGESFTATTKMDGSLGICYWYEGEWRVNTRGSFNSDQAVWAKKWLDENVEMSNMLSRWNTYLFEIIYPSNRIVVDYEGKEGLVLLSAYYNHSCKEYSYSDLLEFSQMMGVEVTERHEFENFEDLFKAREILTKNEEGFVITFENGFKFKLKGEEYCKLHRCLFNMTPLAFWDIYDFENMCIPQEFLEQFPEEFEDQVNEIVDEIHSSYVMVSQTIEFIAWKLPKFVDRKSLYMHLTQFHNGLQGPILTVVDGKSLERWVKKVVRPTANVYFDIYEWSDQF